MASLTPRKEVKSDATVRAIKRKPPITASENPKRRLPEKPSSYIHQSKWVSNNYSDLKLIGKGAFGLVYRARSKRHPEQVVAIKEILKNSLPDNVVCEMDLVQMLGGKNNILSTLATHKDMGAYIVMEYFPHDEFRDVIKSMSSNEAYHYMANMIKSIEYLHSHNIIHRDLKPDNFLYNRKHRRYALIDFGLSQRYSGEFDRAQKLKQRYSVTGLPNLPNPLTKTCQMPCLCEDFKPPCNGCLMKPEVVVNKAGTPRFLAPEILIGSSKQTTKIDIWAMGITLFFLITRKYPYFHARQNLEMVTELAALLGTKTFIDTAEKHGMSLKMDFELRPLNIALFAFTHRYGTLNECTALALPCDYCSQIFQYDQNVSSEDPKNDFCLCRPLDIVQQARILTQMDDRRLAVMLQMCLVVDPDKRESAESLLKKFSV
uniref:non-specific serine/threonine protein kinase n=1 Tax=Panagrellus redivivus TaxID=6233 RepID=A0A7E4VMD2_PANRE